MNTFDPQTFLIIYAIACVIGLLILYAIISSATRAKEKTDLAKIQIKLLISIAIKLGVDLDQVNNEGKSVSEIEKEILTGKSK